MLENPSGHSDLTKLGLCTGHRSRVFLALLGLFCACGGTKPLTVLRCADGQHDGGDGNCVREGTCSDGYYDDGTGTCRPPDPQSGEADIYLPAVANRQLDMVFMIDNSPSMSPKVTKMNAQFPRLIAALQDPSDGTLPDLRIAFIDSDLGTAGAYAAGACGPRTLPDGTQSIFGDLGRFQIRKDPTVCKVADGALFLEYAAGRPMNYTGDINTVFACLAGNMGDFGCGMEHQLQAFEFALAAKGIGNEEQQKSFLRDDAILALVFITDEDDCSAAPQDGMFGDRSELRGESASLRCATRAHECGGRNLADAPPGYPTVASFSHPFKDCHARMGDECPSGTDTAVPTDCNALRSVRMMADTIKALKEDPEHQILVAGLFGWPLDEADMERAEYKIAPLPNPNVADTQHPTVFDYWPVCYDPDHAPTNPDPATGFDGSAAGRGAMGGLREAAYLDEFGENGLKFSICQRDFADTMSTIGERLASMLENACIDAKLADVDPVTPGVQAECGVAWSYPVADPSDASKVMWQEGESLVPCPEGVSQASVAQDCWRLVDDGARCPKNGQRLEAMRTASEIASQPSLPAGTKLHAHCRVCPVNASSATLVEGCER